MLRRKVYDDLLRWKGTPGHKSLLVKGQRQVGKTFIIDLFARENYEHVVYSDLSSDGRFREVFDGASSVDEIIAGMKMYRDPNDFVPGSTVIVLDEIQVCPRARAALKKFTMDGRYDVIASGSLLGVRNPGRRKGMDPDSPDIVFPAGYEDHLMMYSLDFEEFLWARGFPQESIDEARTCIHDRKPMSDVLLKALDRQFRDYMIVGGMPKSVSAFVKEGDYRAAGKELDMVLDRWLKDIESCNLPRDSAKIRTCLYSIPAQLGEDNKKFMYSRIGDGATAQKYDDSILWIDQAGYSNLCRNLRNLSHPLTKYEERDHFKAYIADTGILCSLMGVDSMRAVYEGDYSYNMGAVTENAVAEGILKSGLPVRCYQRTDNTDGKRMEIDFVLESGDDILAIEVKSGRSRKSPSLEKVSTVYDQVNRRVKLARTNIMVDDRGVEHYPLFAACFADSMLPTPEGPVFVAYRGR